MIQISIFKQHLKLFFKNKLYMYLLLLIYLSTTIGLGFYLYFPSDVFFTLTFAVRCIFYESFIFMIITYLFLKKAHKVDLEETIHTISQKENYYFWNAFLVLVFLLLAYNLYILLFLLINTIKTGEYARFMDILFTQYPLNLLLPQFIFLLITALISLIKNTKISMSLFLIASLLMSPYMDTLTWRSQPAFPIDKIVYYIHLPFALFLQSSIWPIDPLYGMQNEPYKISAIIFWILLFMFITFIISVKHSKKMILIGISSVLIIGCFSTIYTPQNIFRLNDKWDGTLSDENYYDIEHRYKDNIYTKEDVNYLITDYKLNIDIDIMLNVEGELHLHSDTKQKDFVLTLYRQYEIDSLQSTKDMTYQQDGDFIRLSFVDDITDATLNIKYHGYHDLYYSNSQGAQLPGFLPWYPMAGEKSGYFNNGEVRTVLRGVNPYNRVKQATFRVNIDAPYPIVCNLDQQGNTYVGTSDSLTIVGGNLERYESNTYHIQNYFPYRFSPYDTVQDDLMHTERWISEVSHKLQNLFNTEDKTFQNKKVIVLSKSIARTQEMGIYAEFDDYILITDITTIWGSFLKYHMANRFDLKSEYVSLILSSCYFSYNSKQELMESIQYTINSNIESLEYEIVKLQSENKSSEEQKKNLLYMQSLLEDINNMNDEEKEQFLTEIGRTIIGEDKYGN